MYQNRVKQRHYSTYCLKLLLLALFLPLICLYSGFSGNVNAQTSNWIIIPPSYAEIDLFQEALNELNQEMLAVYNKKYEVIAREDLTLDDIPTGAILIGATNNLILTLRDNGSLIAPVRLGDEGYEIKTVNLPGGRGVICMDGLDLKSDIYAVYYFIERIKVDSNQLLDMNFLRIPAFKLRMFGDSPSFHGGDDRKMTLQALKLGYNVTMVDGDATGTSTYEAVDPGMFLISPDGRKRAMKNRKTLESSIKRNQDFMMMSCSNTDELGFPAEVLNRSYSDKLILPELRASDLKEKNLDIWARQPVFDLNSERLWGLYKAKYNEFLKNFSDIDIVMIRSGENSVNREEGFIGTNVLFLPEKVLDPGEANLQRLERLAELINETSSIVSNRHRKLYIQRTWDLEEDFLHSNPEIYRAFLSKLSSQENLILSTKITKTDFWRYNPINPTIAIREPKRMVEFQCSREYEGKGAFPIYLGDEYSAGYRFIDEMDVYGVWNWLHGGGQGGPVPQLDIWNQANIYLVSHLMWDPNADPRELAREWAAITFGADVAPQIARILELSEQAILKQFYFSEYSVNHAGWYPSNDWMRDDVIRGERQLRDIYDETKSKYTEILQEKDEAIALIVEMRITLESAKENFEESTMVVHSLAGEEFSGTALYEAVDNSLLYQELLAKVCRNLVAAYYHYQLFNETGNTSHETAARMALEGWEKDWAEYQALEGKPGVSSLYKDQGMIQTMNRIKRFLAGETPVNFRWKIIGPFPNPDGDGLDTVYPPETELNASAIYQGSDEEVIWIDYPPSEVMDGFYDLDNYFGKPDYVTGYAVTEFMSPGAMQARLYLGTDDGVKVWVNGEEVYKLDKQRDAVDGSDVIDINLKQGRNTLLLKISDYFGGWGYYCRVTDMKGTALSNLQVLTPLVN
jgi:hypothetical protein